MRLRHEDVKVCAKLVVTREEILDKLGFDTDDSFYVTLVDWGRGGVEFTLGTGKEEKYKP